MSNTATLEKTLEVIGAIREQGLKVADDSLVVIEPQIGTYVAQGDLNIWPLAEIPATAVEAMPDSQLAPGNSRGARHCIKAEDMAHVKFYRLENATSLHGPVLLLEKPTTIEHPEHGDQLWPAGIIAITFQRQHAEELKRMAD